MTRSLLAVAVALLAVTAGCSGFGGQSATTAAPTDSPTTTAPTTTEPTQSTPAIAAPGFTGGRLVDPLALADAHAQLLSGQSFVRESQWTSGDDETATTLRVENATHWYVRQAFDGRPFLDVESGTVQQYAEGDLQVFRLQRANGSVSYGRHVSGEASLGNAVAGQPSAREYVYAAFTTASWTTIVGERSADGATVYRVVGNASGDATFRGEAVSNFDVYANVTDEGLVRDLRVTYEAEGANVERTLSFSGVGETAVERPEWYDTAVNRTEGTRSDAEA